MKFIFFILFNVVICNFCFSGIFLLPKKNDDQEDILVQGGTILVSKKNNIVSMYKTASTIESGYGNFRFEVLNQTESNINLYFSDLKVIDQNGREVFLIPKKNLVSLLDNSKFWAKFCSCIGTGFSYADANQAGKIKYDSCQSSNFNSKFNVSDRSSFFNGSAHGSSTTITQGQVEVEALRQQAVRQVAIDSQENMNSIESKYEYQLFCLRNFYFDSTTLFPEKVYVANFQVYVDEEIERNLKFLLFIYNIGGEEHVFQYDCKPKNTKKWYRFGF